MNSNMLCEKEKYDTGFAQWTICLLPKNHDGGCVWSKHPNPPPMPHKYCERAHAFLRAAFDAPNNCLWCGKTIERMSDRECITVLEAENARLRALHDSERTARLLAERKAGECAQQVDTLEDAICGLSAELAEEIELRGKLGNLIERTVNTLRGNPPPLHLHGWADLPESLDRTIRNLLDMLDDAHEHIRDLETELTMERDSKLCSNTMYSSSTRHRIRCNKLSGHKGQCFWVSY